MSDQETTENFWKVWNNFQWPEPNPIFYRCYYKDDGTVDFYTMEDLPGSWIEVSKEIYLMSPSARVVDGRLKIIERKKIVKKLKPHQTDGVPCDSCDVSVVVDREDDYIRWKDSENEID